MASGPRRFSKDASLGLALTIGLAAITLAQNPVGTAFTYQGQLQNNGTPQNGPCDLRFRLYDASSGGNQIGATQTVSGVSVANGLFTVPIDFGAGAFTGSARWLETALTCPSGGAFTTLSPRQAMSPAPNAIFAENASVATDGTLGGNGSSGSPLHVASPLALGASAGSATIAGNNTGTGPGVQGFGAAAPGAWGESTTSEGVHGHTVSGGAGVAGYNDGGGAGVYGLSTTGDGVYGQGDGYSGVEGYSNFVVGVRGNSNFSYGVSGTSTFLDGVHGDTTSSNSGVAGVNNNATQGNGVYGYQAAAGNGVYGYAVGDGSTVSGAGLHGVGTQTCSGIFCGPGSYGLYVDGTSFFTSNIDVAGNKNFATPHPTDASKQIVYTALEGPESGTYFRGTAHLVGGYAEIEVPESFRLVSSTSGMTAIAAPVGAPAVIVCMSKSLDRIVFQGSADVDFDYLVNGVRAGFEDHPSIQPNTLFVPRRASDRQLTQLPAEAVRRLKANHILNDDGSVNEETARKMGWDQRSDWNQPDRQPAGKGR